MSWRFLWAEKKRFFVRQSEGIACNVLFTPLHFFSFCMLFVCCFLCGLAWSVCLFVRLLVVLCMPRNCSVQLAPQWSRHFSIKWRSSDGWNYSQIRHRFPSNENFKTNVKKFLNFNSFHLCEHNFISSRNLQGIECFIAFTGNNRLINRLKFP